MADRQRPLGVSDRRLVTWPVHRIDARRVRRASRRTPRHGGRGSRSANASVGNASIAGSPRWMSVLPSVLMARAAPARSPSSLQRAMASSSASAASVIRPAWRAASPKRASALGTFRPPHRGEGEGALEVRDGGRGVEPERPLSRQGQEPQRRRLELSGLLSLPGRTREIQRRRVVIREDIREILHALRRLGLDPPRCRDVSRGPGTLVGAAHTRHRERGCARTRTRPRLRSRIDAPARTSSLRESSRSVSVTVAEIAVAHLGHRPGPEDLPDDGGVGQHRLRVAGERVEARRDQGLDRLRERDLDPLAELSARAHPRRAGPCPGGDARTLRRTGGSRRRARGSAAAARQGSPSISSRAETRRAVSSSVSGARLIVLAFRRPLREVGVALEELGAGRPHHEHRHALGAIGEMLQEREHRARRPSADPRRRTRWGPARRYVRGSAARR